jgi:hypothetical protein
VNDEENWLHGERIECSGCHQWLYRVNHSPFFDEYFLYCNCCPIRVEVSFYDPVVKQGEQQVRQASEARQGERYVALMRTLEERLKPCRCGGRFYHDAPRRCFTCHAPVISDDPIGIDLYPAWMDVSEPDASLEMQAEQWAAQFTRTEDIWQDVHL